ncbi:hypothetical protein TI04_01220 [Achromatium sp. WMS2]|nr:hypothetical protein TI04_01220 [Achromatium sp. WMS2]
MVAKLNLGLTSLLQSSYLGGSGADRIHAMAVTSDAVYVAGYASSTNFPGTSAGAQPNNSGGQDGFVSMLSTDLAGPRLEVLKTGIGSGTVTSAPAGIDCGSDCSETYGGGTAVTLTATVANKSVFASWSGACTNTSGNCTVIMNAAKSVTATFNSSSTGICKLCLPSRGGWRAILK